MNSCCLFWPFLFLSKFVDDSCDNRPVSIEGLANCETLLLFMNPRSLSGGLSALISGIVSKGEDCLFIIYVPGIFNRHCLDAHKLTKLVISRAPPCRVLAQTGNPTEQCLLNPGLCPGLLLVLAVGLSLAPRREVNLGAIA